MSASHRDRVKVVLAAAAAAHEQLIAGLPAELGARVFGRAPLGRETVIASFVEGARVRDDVISALRAAYTAHERAVILIAEDFDAD
jgi:hypothetical protein